MHTITVKADYEVSDEVIETLLEGLRYQPWCRTSWSEEYGLLGVWIESPHDEPWPDRYPPTITPSVSEVLMALREIMEDKHVHYPGVGYVQRALKEGDPGMLDADAADAVWQVVCFGSIIFG